MKELFDGNGVSPDALVAPVPEYHIGRVGRVDSTWGLDSTVAWLIVRLTMGGKAIAPPGAAHLGHPTDSAEQNFDRQSRALRNCQTCPRG